MCDSMSYGELGCIQRAPHMVGRGSLLQDIHAIIKSDQRALIYFTGPGGIGKTRLLEEISKSHSDSGQTWLWTGIIDLYHFHSPAELQRRIAQKLDENHQFFKEFFAEDEKLRSLSLGDSGIQDLQKEIDQIFWKEYALLSRQRRIVIGIDTAELMAFETDVVQELCHIQPVDAVIKNWIAEQLATQAQNTVLIIAGRKRSQVEAWVRGNFETTWTVKFHTIPPLTSDEVRQYMVSIAETAPEISDIHKNQDILERLTHLSEGLPIRLDLMLDLASSSGIGSLVSIFPVTGKPTTRSEIDNLLFEMLHQFATPYSEMIHYLVKARKGLDLDLLRHLVGSEWTPEQTASNFYKMQSLAFVKYRHNHDRLQLFLHDEIYDIYDRFDKASQATSSEYEPFVAYYDERLRGSDLSKEERQEYTLASLYYRFMADPREGFDRYARWGEEALQNYQGRWGDVLAQTYYSELDFQLREEILRLTNRYTRVRFASQEEDGKNPYFNDWMAGLITAEDVDRDCAVRWVNRYIARRDYEGAIQAAENIYRSSNITFAWDRISDTLYKAGLLIAWANALIFAGEQEKEITSHMEEAIALLQGQTPEDRPWQKWWRARLLGSAYNDLGYCYRTMGRYGLALDNYRRARKQFRAESIRDEEAKTLNNMAFCLALVGDIEAERFAELSIEIYQEQGQKAGVAQAQNTLGLVYTMRDHPLWALEFCNKALAGFSAPDVNDARGIGLVSIGIGIALRHRAEQWKREVCPKEEAQQKFGQARVSLERACDIFSDQVKEPVRLWEAYNQLGSLYCDWGWLLREDGELSRSAEYYEKSIQYQEQALELAKNHQLGFDITDALIDLAQVEGDFSFLEVDRQNLEAAKKHRQRAEALMSEVSESVDPVYHIKPDTYKNRIAPERGVAYRLSMGEVHLWRGVWKTRDADKVQRGSPEWRTLIEQACGEFLLSTAYYVRYWDNSLTWRHTKNYLLKLFAYPEIDSKWISDRLKNFVALYGIDLPVIDDLIAQEFGEV